MMFLQVSVRDGNWVLRRAEIAHEMELIRVWRRLEARVGLMFANCAPPASRKTESGFVPGLAAEAGAKAFPRAARN